MEQTKLNGANLTAQVQGKLLEVTTLTTQNGKTLFRHIIMVPAAGDYDYPDTVSVVSDRRMGAAEEVITANVKIRGRRRKAENGNVFYNHDLWEQPR